MLFELQIIVFISIYVVNGEWLIPIFEILLLLTLHFLTIKLFRLCRV